MSELSLAEKRAKRLAQLQRYIEAQIYMSDDHEDLILLGTLFMAAAKNIFLTRYSKEHTRMVLRKYIDDVTR